MTEQTPPPTPNPHSRELFWNFLTGLLVVGIIAALIFFALVYLNPRSTLNPFPLPTPIPALPTTAPAIPTAKALSPTPPITIPTASAAPTQPPPNQPTPTAILATPATITGATPTPITTSNGVFAFAPQAAEAKTLDVTMFFPTRGCQWMGVAGQVFDLRDSPIPLGIEIQLAGILDGKPILLTSLTGTALGYGAQGFYEFTLANKPIASRGTLWLRLLDQSGLALSDRIYFDTYADCSKNLIIINFKQNR